MDHQMYRLVWTRRTQHTGERTLASEPLTRAEALRQFDNCSEIRRSAGAGHGRLRVMPNDEYARIQRGAA